MANDKRTVFVRTNQGFGPVSNWSILAMCVTPEQALTIRNDEMRNKAREVKICDYNNERGWPFN